MGFNIADQEATIGTIQRDYLYMLAVISLPKGLAATTSYQALQSNIDFYNKSAVWAEKRTEGIRLQWGGQYMYFSGVESGSKQEDFIFYDDEKGNMYSFLSACQALTGDDAAHAASSDPDQRFEVEIYEVNTTKSVVTKARLLKGFKVMGVKKSQPNKEGNGLATITATCTWTKAYDDHSAAGKQVTTAVDDLTRFLSGNYEVTMVEKTSGV